MYLTHNITFFSFAQYNVAQFVEHYIVTIIMHTGHGVESYFIEIRVQLKAFNFPSSPSATVQVYMYDTCIIEVYMYVYDTCIIQVYMYILILYNT